MMLSPWFPPRYLWAAIEGAAGLGLSGGSPTLSPRLAPDWKWLGVQNVPFRGTSITWFVARAPDVRLYTNFAFHQSDPYVAYDEDITNAVRTDGHASVALGLRKGTDIVLFAGNTVPRTITTALRITEGAHGTYRMRTFNSMRGAWTDAGTVTAERLTVGIPIELERKGFVLIELQQET
jgi:hypothetical protein